jgi:hypothetical protein
VLVCCSAAPTGAKQAHRAYHQVAARRARGTHTPCIYPIPKPHDLDYQCTQSDVRLLMVFSCSAWAICDLPSSATGAHADRTRPRRQCSAVLYRTCATPMCRHGALHQYLSANTCN